MFDLVNTLDATEEQLDFDHLRIGKMSWMGGLENPTSDIPPYGCDPRHVPEAPYRGTPHYWSRRWTTRSTGRIAIRRCSQAWATQGYTLHR